MTDSSSELKAFTLRQQQNQDTRIKALDRAIDSFGAPPKTDAIIERAAKFELFIIDGKTEENHA